MSTPKPLAGVSDLAEWLGEDISEASADGKRALQCLRMASVLVRQEAGKSWLTSGGELDSPPESAVMVTLYCAGRVFENREAQTRGGLDDLNEAWKVEEAGAYLTESERRMIASLRGGITGLRTISTTRIDDSASQPGGYPVDSGGVIPGW